MAILHAVLQKKFSTWGGITMHSVSKTWAVVLAGGEGSRLREITTTKSGEVIPKQFCSLHGHNCLLEDAMERAQAVAPAERICTVVAEQHRHWWSKVLPALRDENIFVQPKNRGTANGILLALLQIERRDPNAVVALLPADHYVADESVMARSLRAATTLAGKNQGLVYLLGVEPDHPDPELGYIVPSICRADAAGVMRFAEKPCSEKARELIRNGALWNTFIFTGSIRALLSLFEAQFGSAMEAMRQALRLAETKLVGTTALEILYEDLTPCDFSRDVLEDHAQILQVLRVPSCGWTDLGTPQRVEQAVRALGRELRQSAPDKRPSGRPYLDLASGRTNLWLPQAS